MDDIIDNFDFDLDFESLDLDFDDIDYKPFENPKQNLCNQILSFDFNTACKTQTEIFFVG
jgi:hypothetical protein